ncbi:MULTISPECIES: hypothetical protein [unclassified Sphingobium]|uniref:HORMA-1 domain-containing protein n=1 Tax=unclassified Sphingobium TaxID=2611147 RepID=UPI000D16398F|nr:MULTISPECIES: hypothetical protein [unclassified Sphingobium]MBG6118165.1 hypothetical protein [Sphingobium sp. JAI105]PSO09980.1 hypothetical protein C7E20_19440 [Sphingobium sp. AEW4]TWC98334.1 hypothetical protein FB595_12840 [Sphingobium sp. AEW010]TWD18254.1 hypothetical protein FB596_1292 [Sphingobium sp. AEW013]TWD20831.1 hypothetical protein FB594_12940 [Sphingobium sp. AEW001]
MASSYTISASTSFTITHARHMAAKVAADLKRMQRHYGKPSDADIATYEEEVVQLLKAGYLGTVSYGYKRDGNWIEPTLRYMAKDLLGMSGTDDDPGKIKPWADISGASFYSFLTYSPAWDALTSTQQDAFKKSLPFYRGGASEPGISGYLEQDRTYSAGGHALGRSSVRSY